MSTQDQISKLLEKANVLKSDKRFDEAELILNKILEIDPDNLSTIEIRGTIYYDNHEEDKALPDFLKIIKNPKVSTEYYNKIGLIYLMIENIDDAIKFWKEGANKGNEECNKKLDRYVELYRRYKLSYIDIFKKTGINIHRPTEGNPYQFNKIKLISGLEMEYQDEFCIIYANQIGIVISTEKLFKKDNYWGFTYPEINNIELSQDKTNFQIYLKDGGIINFDPKYGLTQNITLAEFIKNYKKNKIAS